jgi:hypothetical protein
LHPLDCNKRFHLLIGSSSSKLFRTRYPAVLIEVRIAPARLFFMVILPPPTPDLALYLNGLSLLFNVYVSQKPGVAAKLGELIEELKSLKPSVQSQTRAELDKRLEQKLLPAVGPVETEMVKRDMDLITVFAEPVRVEDFDYLSIMSNYGSKYAALADKASLFDLRGTIGKEESLLFLPTAGDHLFNAKELLNFLCPSPNQDYMNPTSVSRFDAALTKTGAEFGLRFYVTGKFDVHYRMTGSSRNVEIGCSYVLAAEDRKNWIKLEKRRPVEGFQWVQKRFDAKEVLRFMQAVRSDIMKYVTDLKEEQSLIHGSISSLLREVTQFFDRAERNQQILKA